MMHWIESITLRHGQAALYKGVSLPMPNRRSAETFASLPCDPSVGQGRTDPLVL